MSDARALRFQRRPSPVIPDHRPLFKIGQLLLVLSISSRAGKSSSARLQLFNWALKNKKRSELLIQAAQTKKITVPAWGFDPALAIAVRFAVAEGLLRPVSNGYELTEAGEALADNVREQPELFAEEKATLTRAGKAITELMVDAVAREWGAR